MSVNFQDSRTKVNLMRAFAGESQARNRYTFAAAQAKKEGLAVLERIFLYTAGQEKEHAEIFYNHLRQLSGKTVEIDGSYPVDLYEDMKKVLQAARHNEYEEYEDVYQRFMQEAAEEGFQEVAASFRMIAAVEKTHGDRFQKYADYMEKGRLFAQETKTAWVCLNCGYIHEGPEAPGICPSCRHGQGYFVRADEALAPFI